MHARPLSRAVLLATLACLAAPECAAPAEGVLGTPLESPAEAFLSLVDQLKDVAERCPVLFCAALDDGDEGRPPLATTARTIGDLISEWGRARGHSTWLGRDGDYVACSSGVGAWGSEMELEAGALEGCIRLLSDEQQALVAHGYPLSPVDLPPLAIECIGALFGGSLDGETWHDALLDRHTRLWIAFTPRVAVDRVHSPIGEPGASRSTALRRHLRPVYAALPSDEQRRDAVADWRALKAADPAPAAPVPNLAPALKRAMVRVPAEPVSLADLMAGVAASGGPEVRVDPAVAARRVVVKPGEWDALSLLRAITAACRLSCRSQDDHIELGPLRRVLHPAIAHQADLADGWRSGAFGQYEFSSPEPILARELTDEQAEFLEKALARGDATAAIDAEARVVVEPRVTVRIEVWAPLFDDLTGAPTDAEAPDGFALVQERKAEVLWFWQRLDVGSE